MNLQAILRDFETALDDLLKVANLKEKDAVILGGSSSEILGEDLGSATNIDISKEIIRIFYKKMKENKLFPIVQACEHINRALVVEKAYAEKYDIMPINVVPIAEAGGGLASSAIQEFDQPLVVEKVKRVKAGIDIGDVFIGMHLDPDRVGVVVRSDIKEIGQAHLSMIRTREKLIGGDRAKHY